MKKLIILFLLFLGAELFTPTFAQVSFRVNISSQPIWGPVGYDYVDYYYLPDIEAYYYVPKRKYIYMENGHWISRSNLPARYRNFDVYNTRKVVINESRPYLHHGDYRVRYANTNDQMGRQSIRDSRETRYYQNKHHPEHSKWKENRRNERRQQKEQNKQNNRGRD